MTIDIIMLVALGLFTVKGFFDGFIKIIGSIVGLLIAVYLSSAYSDAGGVLIAHYFKATAPIAHMMASIMIFIIVTNLVALLVFMLKKTWRLVPLGGMVDGIAGAVAGFVEGALIIGFILQLILTTGVNPEWSKHISTSTIAPALLGFTSILWPLVKEKLKEFSV